MWRSDLAPGCSTCCCEFGRTVITEEAPIASLCILLVYPASNQEPRARDAEEPHRLAFCCSYEALVVKNWSLLMNDQSWSSPQGRGYLRSFGEVLRRTRYSLLTTYYGLLSSYSLSFSVCLCACMHSYDCVGHDPTTTTMNNT